MGMKSKIKHIISFIFHGERQPVYTKITYLSPSSRLRNKKIVITGGGRGLGYAMAEKFIAEGAEVLIAGRNEKTLKESCDKLGCKYLTLDVQDVKSFPSFITKANDLLGGINCLVNNAGVSLHENGILNVSEEQYDSQFDTNLKGSFFLTKEFISECRMDNTNETKNILFVSSETGVTVDERPYGLTKAAINSLVQGLAYKYINEGFRVNAIAPGVTASDMTGIRTDGDLYCSYQLTHRYYLPEEMAEIACFLLSDASNILNGQILVCNEGKTINARWR